MSFDSELQARSAAIEEQAKLVEACADPATRAAALELVRSVMDLHRSALERMLAIVDESSEDVVGALIRDPLVESVLILHDLHPHDLERRVTRALEQLRPKLQRYNAEARLLGVTEAAVRVMVDAPPSCGADNLTALVEQVLTEAAPDAQIVIEGAAQSKSNFVSIDALRPADQTNVSRNQVVQVAGASEN